MPYNFALRRAPQHWEPPCIVCDAVDTQEVRWCTGPVAHRVCFDCVRRWYHEERPFHLLGQAPRCLVCTHDLSPRFRTMFSTSEHAPWSDAPMPRGGSWRLGIMRCPGCNTIISKDGGCRHMYCLRCGREFWWRPANAGTLKAVAFLTILFALVTCLMAAFGAASGDFLKGAGVLWLGFLVIVGILVQL